MILAGRRWLKDVLRAKQLMVLSGSGCSRRLNTGVVLDGSR